MKLGHLAPYLPYGLRILRPDNKTILELQGIINNLLVFHEIGKHETYGSIKSNTNKPILRPLSDLTKEIEVNGEKFVPIRVFEKENDYNSNAHTLKLLNHGILDKFPYKWYVKLLEWHFDVFNLIEKGEAIDINTLEL